MRCLRRAALTQIQSDLDYCLQRFGHEQTHIQVDLQVIDAVCGDLIKYYQPHNIQVIILSEYGITLVQHGVNKPPICNL
ncbi:MAG: alkaline phosphatase family protein [Nostoc sp.]